VLLIGHIEGYDHCRTSTDAIKFWIQDSRFSAYGIHVSRKGGVRHVAMPWTLALLATLDSIEAKAGMMGLTLIASRILAY